MSQDTVQGACNKISSFCFLSVHRDSLRKNLKTKQKATHSYSESFSRLFKIGTLVSDILLTLTNAKADTHVHMHTLTHGIPRPTTNLVLHSLELFAHRLFWAIPRLGPERRWDGPKAHTARATTVTQTSHVQSTPKLQWPIIRIQHLRKEVHLEN